MVLYFLRFTDARSMGKDADRSREVWLVAIIFTAISWITVGLRIWVRARIIRNFGLDDWLMVVAMCFFQGYLFCQIGGVIYGTGRHHWDNTPENVQKALRFWWFCELFYILASAMLKISVGVFLLRIATNKWHKLLIRLLIVGCAVFGIAYFFNALFECMPFHLYWTENPGAKGCVSSTIVYRSTLAASGINALADWTFAILPAFMIWPLKMDVKAKLGVAGILAIAAIGSTATLIRIPYLKSLTETNDFLWTTTDVAIWSTIEPGIGITAGSIATLRPLLYIIMYKFGLGTANPYSLSREYGASNRSRSRSRLSRSRRADPSKNSAMGITTTVMGECFVIEGQQQSPLPHMSMPMGVSRIDRIEVEEAQIGSEVELTEVKKAGEAVIEEHEFSRSPSSSYRSDDSRTWPRSSFS